MSGNPENQLHDEADDLVGHQEKNRRHDDENEHHRRGDHGFAPRRPSDFRHLLPHFTEKLDWVLRHTHRSGGTRAFQVLSSGRSGGTRTHDPRFWRPMLYQLSYTPAVRRHPFLPAATLYSTT